jgi:hypothetical protein
MILLMLRRFKPWSWRTWSTAAAALQASGLSRRDILQRRVVQHRLRQQPLQLTVLHLQRLQTLRVSHLKPSVFRLSFVQRRLADPVLAAQIRPFCPSRMQPQDLDDFLVRDTDSTLQRESLGEQVTVAESEDRSGCAAN